MNTITERTFFWAVENDKIVNHVWFSHDGKDIIHTLCGLFTHALDVKQDYAPQTCDACAQHALSFLMPIP